MVSVVEWLAQHGGFATQEGRYFLGWALFWPPYGRSEAPVAARSLPDSASSGGPHTADPSMGCSWETGRGSGELRARDRVYFL